MGLDISQITNEALRKFAAKFDTDDTKGVLSQEEYSIFASKASEAKAEGISEEDFLKALQLYISDEAKASTAKTVTNPANATDNKNEKARAMNHAFRALDELVAAAKTRDELIEALDEKFTEKFKDNEYYVEFKNSVQAVIELMPEYSSTQDVQKQHALVLKKMRAAGIRDAHHEKILRKLEQVARNEIKLDNVEEIAKLYADEIEADGQRTNEVIIKDIKSDLRANKEFKSDERRAVRSFEKIFAEKEGRQDVAHYIYNVKNVTDVDEIIRTAEENMKKDNAYDKYSRKALHTTKIGNTTTGRRSFGKVVAEQRANETSVEQSKLQLKEDVLKALGEESELYNALLGGGLITELENGQVDLTKLSELIVKNVGQDFEESRYARIDKAISEVLGARTDIAYDTNLHSLTEKETEELMRLCGVPKEPKAWDAVLLEVLKGAVNGGVAAGGAAALNRRQSVRIEEQVISSTLDLDVNLPITDSAFEHLKGLEGVTITETATGVHINVLTTVVKPGALIQLSKLVAPSTWKGALIGAAMGLVSGLCEDRGEVPITSIAPEETNYEEYIKKLELSLGWLKGMDFYEPLKCIAAAYYNSETQTWDNEGYRKQLKRMAGNDKLNMKEIIQRCTVEEDKQPVIKPEEENFYSIRQDDAVEPTFVDVPEENVSYSSWDLIAGQYPCLVDDNGLAYTKRVIKLAQGIHDGKYTKDRMDYLYNLSNSELKELNASWFDYNVFMSFLNANTIGVVKFPENLAGCDRVRNSLVAPKWEGEAHGITKHSNPKSDRIKLTEGQNAKYYVRFNGGNIEGYDTKEARQEKIDAFLKKYPNAELKTWEKQED